jgi:hypothetical protein
LPEAASAEGDEPLTNRTALTSVHSRLLECAGHESRSRCVLALLAEHTQAERAYLHAERDGRLRLVCGMPDEQAPEALGGALERYLQGEMEQGRVTVLEELTAVAIPNAPTLDTGFDTGSSELLAASPTNALLVHGSGMRMYPVLLETRNGGERVIAGIATLAVRSDAFTPPPSTLLAVLATALLENDDVDPVTRID